MEIFLPYSRQWIDEEDIAAVTAVLRSPLITQGPRIREFEEALAASAGAQYAVVFNSGTSALHGAYFAAGLGPGDEVIASPITFVATTNAALYLGARPVFADIEPDTGNIDPEAVVQLITPRTRILAPTHYAGHPVEMEALSAIAQRHNLIIVEDACHAQGAQYRGHPIGSCSHSHMAVFSFHPLKHITTGEGGAVLTNDKDLYEKLLLFRTHGITKNPEHYVQQPQGPWYHEMQYLGYNYRMTDFAAALGISQLRKLDSFVQRRREIARHYDEAFADNPFFDTPPHKAYARHAYHLYPIRLKNPALRSKAFEELRNRNLGVQVHYIPVYLQPYYQRQGYSPGLCPQAEDFYTRQISIPIYPAMSDEDIGYVTAMILETFESL